MALLLLAAVEAAGAAAGLDLTEAAGLASPVARESASLSLIPANEAGLPTVGS
jgi:hypothetical protein